MKERVLVKQNVFTCVMFGAIFLFVLYQSVFANFDMSVLAFIIALPTFMLSVLKLMVDILEDLNDRITSYLKQMEECEFYDFGFLDTLRKHDNDDVLSIIEKYVRDQNDDEWKCKDYVSYHNARKTREYIRIIRRGILYAYYSVFMIMFLLLLLHSELSMWIQNTLGKTVDINLFTIWSLIIVLLEIMMKSIFEDMLFLYLEKKTGVDLQWY